MSYSPGQNYQFSYAMAAALVIHGIVLFWVTFHAISNSPTAQQMEVTLSHSSSDTKPEEADFIAQSNQEGSGDSDENKEVTTFYEALFSDPSINPAAPLVIPEEKQSQQVIVNPRIITTTGESHLTVAIEETELVNDEESTEGDSDNKNLTELSREIASLEARLAEKQQQFTKKPRVLVLTSASTIAADDAEYVHQWRDRVEAIGNLHYPEEARDKQLYGDVRLLVKLNANGIVEETTIMASSGYEILDRAAIESIRLASPFEPFPKDLADKYDRIDVIRTWQFRKNRLQAKAG